MDLVTIIIFILAGVVFINRESVSNSLRSSSAAAWAFTAVGISVMLYVSFII